MSGIPEALRPPVVRRAGSRCEYCRLPTEGQVATFPIDHIVPRSEGGATELANLALACPNCNGHKWAHRGGVDLVTGKPAPIFNPRSQIWAEHFRWSATDRGYLEGKTPCGRATIERLQMNEPIMVAVRLLLIRLGLLPEAVVEPATPDQA